MVQLDRPAFPAGPLAGMLGCWQPAYDDRPDLVWPAQSKLLEPLEAVLRDFHAKRCVLAYQASQPSISFKEARGVVRAGETCIADRAAAGRRMRMYRSDGKAKGHVWVVLTVEHHGVGDYTEEIILRAALVNAESVAVSLEQFLELSWQELANRGLGEQSSRLSDALAKEVSLTPAQRATLEVVLQVHDDVQALFWDFSKANLVPDPSIVVILERLAVFHVQNGEPKRANHCFGRVLSIQESTLGPESVEVSTTLMNLGSTYGDLGDPWEKRKVLERCVRIREENYGGYHPEVAKALTNLANAHGDIGDQKQKKLLLERALDIMKITYGPHHLEVARLSTNLANALGALGHSQLKKEHLEEALRIMTEACGENHVNVAIILANLGAAYGDLGHAERSRQTLERALRIKEVNFGRDHVEVAITRFNLASCLHRLGDIEEAIREAEIASGVFLVTYGADSHQVLSSRKLLTSWRLQVSEQFNNHAHGRYSFGPDSSMRHRR